MSSARTKRHERMQRRLRRKPQDGLLLTALIDIFTNLLFFLLVIAQNPSKLPNVKDLQLPTSIAEKQPKEMLAVTITQKEILVQDKHILSLDEARAVKDDQLIQLTAELKSWAAKTPPTVNEKGIPEREVTIIGDRAVPYTVLRKVMATCSLNDYSKMSFAVAHGGGKT